MAEKHNKQAEMAIKKYFILIKLALMNYKINKP